MLKILLISISLLLMGCTGEKEHKIEKKISFNNGFEPSGITKIKDVIYIISDESELAVYKDNKIDYYKINGDKDLEGITSNGKQLFVAEEGKDNIIEISKTGKILNVYDINRKYNGKKVISKKGDGLESLSFYKEDIDNIYFFTSNQSDEFSGDDKSAILLIKINKKTKKGIIDKYYPQKIIDISGIHFKEDILYFLSDGKNKLYFSDINGNVLKSIKVEGKDQEGLFIENNLVYIADDSGNVIVISNIINI